MSLVVRRFLHAAAGPDHVARRNTRGARVTSGRRSLWLMLLLVSAAASGESFEAQMAAANAAFERADITAAIALYRRVAEAGYAPAQTRLAYLLDHAEANEEAVKWYRLAADQGYADAQYGLAHLYASGEGVARDYGQAVEWFTRAALQDHTAAIHVLALAHEKGELGLRIGYDEAVRWLNAGVDAGDVWSIHRLADAYRRGELGLRLDPERARALEARLPAGARGDRR